MKKTKLVDANASGAVAFDDLSAYEQGQCFFPISITFDYGQAIDLMRICYNKICLPQHGFHGGGRKATLEFLPGEHIIKITGVTASYWNNSFIFNLLFHTDQGRTVGIENQWDGKPVKGTPFTIECDKGYAIACLFGKFASPCEGMRPLSNYSFLSAIGAYQKPIAQATKGTFEIYTQAVKAPVFRWLMDHTGVCAFVGYYSPSGQWTVDNYRFGCHGSLPVPEARYLGRVTGNLELAIALACGNPKAKRINNDFITAEDDCGIIYMTDGVCHQMTNRIMAVTGSVIPLEQVWCARYSIWKFGVYGLRWEEWKNACMEKLDVQNVELYKENVSTASLLKTIQDPLTRSLVSLENKNLDQEQILYERTKLMLTDCFGDTLAQEQTDRLIQAVSPGNICSTDALQTEQDEEARARAFMEEMKQTLHKFQEVLGAQGFQKFFNASLEEILERE